MAARQAEAHARLGRFKAGVVEICKRVFPRPFTQAETALGQRLTTVSDEILLAYLSSFCSDLAINSAAPAAGLDELRAALSQIGVPLPLNADLTAWAGAVRTAASAGLLNAPAAAAPAAARPDASPAEIAADAAGGPTAAAVEPSGSGVVEDAGSLFEDLFDDAERGASDTADAAGALDERALFDDADVLSGDEIHAALDGDADIDLADLFDDVWTGEAAPAADAPVGNLPAPDTADQPPARPAEGRAAGTGHSAAPDGSLPALEPPVETTTADPVLPVAPPADAPLPQPASDRGEDQGHSSSISGPMKLIASSPAPKAPRKRTTRTPRVSAARPDPLPFDVAVPSTGVPVPPAGDPAVRTAALQAVLAAKPVFLSDIAAALGSEAAAAAWEESERADKDAAVWFIAPSGRGARARNAARGNLVIPHEHASAPPFAGSRWAECSTKFRGRPLYELGVLMRVFDSDIVSVDVSKEVVTLRLSTSAGIVGVLVSMSTRLDRGSAGRTALAASLESLLRERSSRIAVLTVHEAALDAMVQALEEERVSRGWQPSTTVVAARAWEYASRSAQAVQAIFA